MIFLDLLKQLEHRLGYHQLPVNPNAKELAEIFDSSPVHGDLTIRVVHEIYKINRCQKITDDVDHTETNNALVPVRLGILRSQKTDVDAFLFMDDLCHAVKDILLQDDDIVEDTDPEPDTAVHSKAMVIDLAQYRHRLKFWA